MSGNPDPVVEVEGGPPVDQAIYDDAGAEVDGETVRVCVGGF